MSRGETPMPAARHYLMSYGARHFPAWLMALLRERPLSTLFFRTIQPIASSDRDLGESILPHR